MNEIGVFGVEDTAVQVCWESLPAADAVLRAGDVDVPLDHHDPGRPGAVVLEGLAPDTDHELVLEVGGGRRAVGAFRTLAPPPGRLLCRFATISDLHIGERGFGLLPRVRELPARPPEEGYAVRCARAAIAEATAWGAQALVVKGDLTFSGRPKQWELVAEVLGEAPMPVHTTLGNHDVVPKSTDGRDILARHGISLADEPVSVDLPGIRLVLGHSAVPRRSVGAVDRHQRETLVRLAGGSAGAAFVTLHHYVDRLPVPSRYPAGIPKREGEPLLRALAQANAATLVSFGHTHRNRRGTRHGLAVTEVGSTKDYPGVWAGYAVHEGGIRQVVRRISPPDCLEWTDKTRRVLGGFWGLWAPGRLTSRCFSHQWPAHPGSAQR
ncbi:MAG: metallophosphoesterase family protein [Actinobacteria bacterium]|nr:metallophosphoesterase family protein [Actinomycetota bacterium]